MMMGETEASSHGLVSTVPIILAVKYFRSVPPPSEGLYPYPCIHFRKFFFKTHYEKVIALFHFVGSKLFFSCRTKCYGAQCLPFNHTVSNPIVVVH